MGNRDIVLRAGRVVDPGSGLDGIRDVAVTGNRVAEVGDGLPRGHRKPADQAGRPIELK